MQGSQTPIETAGGTPAADRPGASSLGADRPDTGRLAVDTPATDAPTTDTSTADRPAAARYRVQLDAYAGPLDLLLYLVKRHEIDLQDIPMAELVEQYLAHLRVIETVDVDKAGEFLVMAATLVEIKSQLLMPRPEAAEDGEGDADAPGAGPAIDPRFELVQQLLAYKRFKDLANALEDRAADWDGRYPAAARTGQPAADPALAAPGTSAAGSDDGDPDSDADDPAAAPPIDLDLEDVNILDLCAAFGRVMDSIGHLGDHEVTYDDTPISLHADDIADRLARDGGESRSMTLRQVFTGRSRGEAIGLFLATLELVRQHKVRVVQGEDLDDIRLELLPEDQWDHAQEPDDSPDWRNPDTGEVEYDWPSEQAKQRAQRRAKLRHTWDEKSAEKVGGKTGDAPQPEAVSADSDGDSGTSLGEDASDDESADFTAQLDDDGPDDA